MMLAVLWICLMISVVRGFGFGNDDLANGGALFEDAFNVKKLTDATFYKEVINTSKEGGKIWVVDFYSPWCPHCRHFAPHWEGIADYFAKSPLVQIASVDCSKHNKVCDREGIYGYPAIKLYNLHLFTASKDTKVIKQNSKDKLESATFTDTSNRNKKGVTRWIERKLREANLDSGVEKKVDDIKKIDDRKEKLSTNLISSRRTRLMDSAMSFMFSLEGSIFRGSDVLQGERYDAALVWLQAVSKTFPIKANQNVLLKLVKHVQSKPVWTRSEWNYMVQTWKKEAELSSIPSDLFTRQLSWQGCASYTCGLWTLFHTLSVNLPDDLNASVLVDAIRKFVMNFFGCQDCVRHFLKANPPEIVTRIGTDKIKLVIWLWRMHNIVNKVTKRAIWPSKSECSICYAGQDATVDMFDVNGDNIVRFMKAAYRTRIDDAVSQISTMNSLMSGGFYSLYILIAISIVGVVMKNVYQYYYINLPTKTMLFGREHTA